MSNAIQKARKADLAARQELLAPPETIQQTSAVRHPDTGGAKIRRAIIAEVPTNQSYIKASLLSESTGIAATEGDDFEVTVYADIADGTRLDRVAPLPSIGLMIFVTKHVYDNAGTPEDRWFFVTTVTTTEVFIGENP